jgi:thiol-disulfide isomerase/thioredoxin
VNRRTSLVALVALGALALGAVLFAGRSDPSRIAGIDDVDSVDDLPVLADAVPSVEQAEGWLNSEPLDDADLVGKVVVYDFWTYSCVNCVRTFPYLRAWQDRYEEDGLVIIGVHSPEFEFEKDHDNVESAVEELGVTWPVALDDEMAIWRSFNNQFWPAKYVTDRQGQLRFVHPGEGLYDETEDVLRVLLGVEPGSRRAGGAEEEPSVALDQTPETYLGSLRGTGSTPQDLQDGVATFEAPDPVPDDRFALEGAWQITPEFAQSADDGTALVLRYRGAEVNLVMEVKSDVPIEVAIELDGKPLPPSMFGDGVVQVGSRSVVSVRDARLYPLVAGGPSGTHTLTLRPAGPGVRAYAFTFGST